MSTAEIDQLKKQLADEHAVAERVDVAHSLARADLFAAMLMLRRDDNERGRQFVARAAGMLAVADLSSSPLPDPTPVERLVADVLLKIDTLATLPVHVWDGQNIQRGARHMVKQLREAGLMAKENGRG